GTRRAAFPVAQNVDAGQIDHSPILFGEPAQPFGIVVERQRTRIFILMASRRLKSDRFFTDDFRPEIYTEAGFQWVQENTYRSVVARHCPALAVAMADARNPFFPWTRAEP
ncbi:MAG: peroxidase family protein, partial [Pseudomonadota bacterium]